MDIETILRMFELAVKYERIEPEDGLIQSLVNDECWERLFLLNVACLISTNDPDKRQFFKHNIDQLMERL